MKKSILLVLAFAFATVAFAAVDNGPEKINLKVEWKPDKDSQKSVIFDHAFHQTNNTCTECHATDEGGKFRPAGEIAAMTEKNVAHSWCWTCHNDKKVSVKKICTKCHTGPK